MVSISETFGKIKKKAKESIEREKLIRAKEKITYKNAKIAEEKVQEEKRRAERLEREANRLEAARIKGIKDALPGAKKEKVKSALGSSLRFLKAHVEFTGDKPKRRRKMKHKGATTKRRKSRRYK